jgi:hypothetical protein
MALYTNADVGTSEFLVDEKGLQETIATYRLLAETLDRQIEDVGTNIEVLVNKGIQGSEATTNLFQLWNVTCGTSGMGLKDVMHGYSTKLLEAAARIDQFLADTRTADSALGQEAKDMVTTSAPTA